MFRFVILAYLGALVYGQFTRPVIKEICLGLEFVCVLFGGADAAFAGRLKCFGDNRYGQLGLGDNETRGDQVGELGDALPFVDVGSLVSSLACSDFHVCVLLAPSGTQIKCFGRSHYGQLGYESTASVGDEPGEMGAALPIVNLGHIAPITKIVAGCHHTCVLFASGLVKCFGWGAAAGFPTDSAVGSTPNSMGTNLPFLHENVLDANMMDTTPMIDIAAAARHTCIVLQGGAVKCFGSTAAWYYDYIPRKQTGSLGQPIIPCDPECILHFHEVVATIDLGTTSCVINRVFTGNGASCIMCDDKRVKCFGLNDRGQFGIPYFPEPREPKQVPFIPYLADKWIVSLSFSLYSAGFIWSDGQAQLLGTLYDNKPFMQQLYLQPSLGIIDFGSDRQIVALTASSNEGYCFVMNDNTLRCTKLQAGASNLDDGKPEDATAVLSLQPIALTGLDVATFVPYGNVVPTSGPESIPSAGSGSGSSSSSSATLIGAVVAAVFVVLFLIVGLLVYLVLKSRRRRNQETTRVRAVGPSTRSRHGSTSKRQPPAYNKPPPPPPPPAVYGNLNLRPRYDTASQAPANRYDVVGPANPYDGVHWSPGPTPTTSQYDAAQAAL